MLKVQRYPTEALSTQFVLQIVELKNMVWPSSYDWPEGVVDLNGEGY